MNELRFTFRQLLKKPGFTAVAVLTLALGIGVNSAIFSFVHAVLLRPLPYQDADRLVQIASINQELGVMNSRSSHPNVRDWQERSTLFDEIATFQEWDGAVTVDGKSEPVRVNWVTPNLLSLLGIKPLHGRLLSDKDMDSGILLPYSVWQRLFDGDPGAIGRKIKCDGEATTIVGILPPNAAVPVQGFSPFDQAFLAADIRRTVFPRDLQLHSVVGRLKPGVTVVQAQAELSRVAADLEREHPDTNRGWGVKLTPLKGWKTQLIRPALLTVYGATGIILLLACLNVSNLLLIRLESRQKELAIRSALGSTRGQLLRQVLGESLLLSLMGAGVGAGLALGCGRLMLQFAPASLGLQPDSHLESSILLSATVVTLLAAVVSGVFPAWRLNQGNLSSVLGETGRAASPGRGRHRLLNGLVVGQIAISTMLLVATGLTIRSFLKLMKVDPGFSRNNAISFRIDPYPNAKLTPRILEAVSAVPGVKSVGGANHELLNDLWSNGVRITSDDRPDPSAAVPTADFWRVTTDYFSAAGIPLSAGRVFQTTDPFDTATNGPARVLINEALARQLFRDQNPVGRTLRILPRAGAGIPREIIGVVGSVKHRGLDRADVAMIYMHVADAPAMVVRTSANPGTLLPAIREAVAQVDSQLILSHIFTTEQIVNRSLADRRFATSLMFGFAALGTLLAALGLYGVTAYAVSQRTREIGVRMVLGAQREDVLRSVLGRGLLLAGMGLVVGVTGGLIVTRAIRSVLFEVSPVDPLTFAGTSLGLVLVAILASWFPARRAMKVDPMEALRHE